jgi:hypothetical protein
MYTCMNNNNRNINKNENNKPMVMRVAYLIGRRQTDMDGPIRCSSLTLEREDHLTNNERPTSPFPRCNPA